MCSECQASLLHTDCSGSECRGKDKNLGENGKREPEPAVERTQTCSQLGNTIWGIMDSISTPILLSKCKNKTCVSGWGKEKVPILLDRAGMGGYTGGTAIIDIYPGKRARER